MPLVLFDKIEKKLKNILQEHYLLDFSNISFDDRNMRSLKRLFDNEAIPNDEIEQMCEMVFRKAIEICNNSLPGDCSSYAINKKNTEALEKSLLKYIVMSFYLNVDKLHLDASSGKHESISQYFEKLLKKDVTKETKENAKSNFYKLFKKTTNIHFFDQIIYDTEKTKNNTEDDIYTKGFPTVEVSAFQDYANGVLIRKFNSNPYIIQDRNFNYSNITDFFMKKVYPELRGCSKSIYDFCATEEVERVKGMYYIDSLYDFYNNLYIAVKMKELECNELYRYYGHEQLCELMSLCMMIPDVFSKKYYIDLIFHILSDKNISKSDYLRAKERDYSLGDLGNHFNFTEVANKNLCLCKQYIMYISKIYLPVLSACFYVLMKDLIEVYIKNNSFSEELSSVEIMHEISKNAVEYLVSDYYENYETKCNELLEFSDRKAGAKKDDLVSCFQHLQTSFRNIEVVKEPNLFNCLKNHSYTKDVVSSCCSVIVKLENYKNKSDTKLQRIIGKKDLTKKDFDYLNEFLECLSKDEKMIDVCQNISSIIDKRYGNVVPNERKENNVHIKEKNKSDALSEKVRALNRKTDWLKNLQIGLSVKEKEAVGVIGDDLKDIESLLTFLEKVLYDFEEEIDNKTKPKRNEDIIVMQLNDKDIKGINENINNALNIRISELTDLVVHIVNDGLHCNLVSLYKAIKENIFADKEKYETICKSLSVLPAYNDYFNSVMLENYISFKVESDLNQLSNAVVNESSEYKFNGLVNKRPITTK